jgi:hypothetical protein
MDAYPGNMIYIYSQIYCKYNIMIMIMIIIITIITIVMIGVDPSPYVLY